MQISVTSADPIKPDSYIFETNWLGGLCATDSCEIKEFNINREVFNIHGLWPERKQQSLEQCDTEKFAFDNLDNEIKSSARKNWVSIHYNHYRNADATASFITHEYIKHGSCSRKLYNENKPINPRVKRILDHAIAHQNVPGKVNKRAKWYIKLTLAL